MAECKKVWFNFEYEDCDAFAKLLEYMARQGWHFKEWKLRLIFEKGEPEDAVYDVQVFPKAKNGDYKPEGETLDFAEYCEAAGWKLIDGKRKFCVFKQIQESAVPIVTEEEKFENVRKACRSKIWSALIMGICAILNLYIAWTELSTTLFSNFQIFVGGLWIFIMVLFIVRFVRSEYQIHQAKKRIESGESLFFGKMSRKDPQLPMVSFTNSKAFLVTFLLIVLIVCWVSGIFYFITTMISTLVVLMIIWGVQVLRPGRKGRWIFAVVLCIFIILLPVGIVATVVLSDTEEMSEESELEDEMEIQKSIFGYSSEYNYVEPESAADDSYEYDFYHLNHYVPGKLQEQLWNSILKRNGLDHTDARADLADLYHAQAAVSDDWILVLDYGQDILLIEEYDALSQNQIVELTNRLGIAE